MKNQYFGDINDYKKYSILRILSGYGQIQTSICWVLTENDARNDGSQIQYLNKPERWQDYDPVVFEYLREHVIAKGIRDVRTIEKSDVLPNCSFYSELLHDGANLRDEFFKEFFDFAKGTDLIFFDPDNGIEVKSTPRGKKGSSKYVYWDEVQASYQAGHSLLIYQHFPRKPRESFLISLVQRFKGFIHASHVISFCTHHVVFLLLPQKEHEDIFIENSSSVEDSWGDVIKVKIHDLAASVTSI